MNQSLLEKHYIPMVKTFITKVVGSGGGAAGTYGQWGAGDLKGGIAGGSGGGQGTYPGGHTTPQAGSVASPDGRSPTTQGNAGGYTNPPGNAFAGSGGGGAGGAGGTAGTAGTANTGSGGGAGTVTSGAGGSGIVIVRYLTNNL